MDKTYTHKTLIQKLGIQEGQKILFLNKPSTILVDFTDVDTDFKKVSYDFILLFAGSLEKLYRLLPQAQNHLEKSGMLWIAWPKKQSKIATDINEHIVHNAGLEIGLVDVKVASIDATWSGFKFVYRLKDR